MEARSESRTSREDGDGGCAADTVCLGELHPEDASDAT
jgi:hypothetical protein